MTLRWVHLRFALFYPTFPILSLRPLEVKSYTDVVGLAYCGKPRECVFTTSRSGSTVTSRSPIDTCGSRRHSNDFGGERVRVLCVLPAYRDDEL